MTILLNPKRFAFTLMELMISMVISALMLFFIFAIFNDTSAAVRRGNGISEIIGSSRTIGDQIARDSEKMIGPTVGGGDGGFLVILNHRIEDVPVIGREPGHGQIAEFTRDVRDDQLVFFRDVSGDNWEPLAPSYSSSFNSTSSATAVRIWYGHGLRTVPDGTTGDDPLGVDTVVENQNLNKIGTDWSLVRQALFLGLDTGNLNGRRYVMGATYASTIFSGSGFPPLPGALTPALMYMGFADVSETTLGGPLGITATMPLNQVPGQPGISDYAIAAYDYTFGIERLWVNPTPTGNDFAHWKIGQQHAIFANHVSDFEVAFAGDYFNVTITDAGQDGDIDIDIDGNIKWYDMNTPLPEDMANPANGFHHEVNAPPTLASHLSHANAAYVWEHGAASTNWPYLIRIRYRVHDARGMVADGVESGRWFEQIIKVNRP